jgi:hypothetical protein
MEHLADVVVGKQFVIDHEARNDALWDKLPSADARH